MCDFLFLPTTWAATLCLRGIVDVSLVLETLSLSLAAECGCLFTVTGYGDCVWFCGQACHRQWHEELGSEYDLGMADKPATDSGVRNWVVNMTLAWQTSRSWTVGVWCLVNVTFVLQLPCPTWQCGSEIPVVKMTMVLQALSLLMQHCGGLVSVLQ